MHQWVRRTVLIVQDFLRQASFRKARFLPGIVPPNDMISHSQGVKINLVASKKCTSRMLGDGCIAVASSNLT